MSVITEFDINNWGHQFSEDEKNNAIESLENGKVIYFPSLAFDLSDADRQFLSTDFVCPKSKNVSFNVANKVLSGLQRNANNENELKSMMQRFAQNTQQLVQHIFPHYQSEIQVARTSYRPIQIKNRKSSNRKDDTKLHVDAFPATPVGEKRILRVFSNINHLQHPRVWRIGEPFENVAAKFLPDVRKPYPMEAQFLDWLKITRGRRTDYDHYMLGIHHKMKADKDYQENVDQIEFHFPPGSTWIVYTDQVSHAAMSGQFLLEQSFYLPVSAMKHPSRAPSSVLKSLGN